MHRSTVLAVSLLLSTAAGGAALGQEAEPSTQADTIAVPSAANDFLRFETTLRAFEKSLAEAPAYEAALETKWESERQGAVASGAIASRLVVQNPDWFSLNLQAQGPGGVSYRVVTNGSHILREMGARRAYSLASAEGDPRIAIESDGLTLAALRSAGVDFLLRRDLHGALVAQTIRAVEGPVVDRDGQRLRSWTLTLADGAQTEFLFTTDDRTVPVERNSVLTVPLPGGGAFTMRQTTRLTWNFDVHPQPETFSTAPTPGFERVFDLSGNAVAAGERLEGREAPGAVWQPLEGEPVSLRRLKGRTPVVLFFWATWAAPSAEAMPDLQSYASEFSRKGVRIVAVNVGETAEQAAAFASEAGYGGELGLDPRAETMAAFGLESTPSVVLIDRQGVVRGVWQGLEGDAKKKIFEATVAMLQTEAASQER